MTADGVRFPAARIAVFAKAPVPGRVKTRLARRLGRAAAAAAYRAMLRERLASLAAARLAPLELWVAPHPHPYLRGLARRYGAGLRVQPGGDLGARMATALGEAGPTVVIGGDCPGMPASTVAQALDALYDGVSVVVAPAEDGGYTLIGSRQPVAALFRRMPWGSDRVMAQTRQRIARLGLLARELPVSWDVDDYRDWRRWRSRGAVFGTAGRGPYR